MAVDAENEGAGSLTLRKRGGILTVHGINTVGKWQDDVSTWIQDAGFLCSRVTYGRILFTSPFPFALTHALELVEERYNELRRRQLSVSVIAHSFGSLTVGNLLFRKPSLKFDRLVLYGSVLSPTFPWRACAANGQVHEILHEMGGQDIWPWFAPAGFILQKQSGWSGVRGFRNPPRCMTELFHAGSGHSDLQSEEHFKTVWIPFLVHGPAAVAHLRASLKAAKRRRS
ncbi:MAG: hypothetical protein QOE82_355 [Thermoanaerobaculia bacterium]|nr:hypothetical protein [Thermoanaerobaculia bacterium]